MSTPDLPIVLEGGVLHFDDDGTLNVHLAHSAARPHPVVTHPDGGRSDVPADVSEIVVRGSGRGEVRGHLAVCEVLPEDGLVLRVHGFDYLQVEGSGDITIVVRSPSAIPTWFSEGKVHRFGMDGRGAPRRWVGSRDPGEEQRRTEAAEREARARAKAAPREAAAPEPAKEPAGCLSLLRPMISFLIP